MAFNGKTDVDSRLIAHKLNEATYLLLGIFKDCKMVGEEGKIVKVAELIGPAIASLWETDEASSRNSNNVDANANSRSAFVDDDDDDDDNDPIDCNGRATSNANSRFASANDDDDAPRGRTQRQRRQRRDPNFYYAPQRYDQEQREYEYNQLSQAEKAIKAKMAAEKKAKKAGSSAA